LGHLASLFASIKVGAYADCMTFMAQRPEIMDENKDDFIKDAVGALVSSQPQSAPHEHARRCIQQSLIIQHCKPQNRTERAKFFAELEAYDSTTKVNFLMDARAVMERCLQKAHSLQNITAKRPAQPAVMATTAYGSVSRPSQRVQQLSRQTNSLNPQSLVRRLDTLTVTDDKTQPKSSGGPGIQQERHHRESSATAGSNASAVARFNREGFLRPRYGTTIRGTNGEEEELDASYHKRDSPTTFFVKGKVFALIWHEVAGGGEPSDGSISEISFRDRFNEPIISHIRRMVVIRPGQDNCWAIPIHTYRGQGVAKHGFKQVDVDGHAVIHAANTSPYVNPHEPEMMKSPLKVDLVSGERLDRMSRINFTTVHTVQHNVKVKNIGMVHRDSLGDLQRHWSAQAGT
jgi:hypothetical protein